MKYTIKNLTKRDMAFLYKVGMSCGGEPTGPRGTGDKLVNICKKVFTPKELNNLFYLPTAGTIYFHDTWKSIDKCFKEEKSNFTFDFKKY